MKEKTLEDFGIRRLDKLIKISIIQGFEGVSYKIEFTGFEDSNDKIGALVDALASTSVQLGMSSDVTMQTVETALTFAEHRHRKGERK